MAAQIVDHFGDVLEDKLAVWHSACSTRRWGYPNLARDSPPSMLPFRLFVRVTAFLALILGYFKIELCIHTVFFHFFLGCFLVSHLFLDWIANPSNPPPVYGCLVFLTASIAFGCLQGPLQLSACGTPGVSWNFVRYCPRAFLQVSPLLSLLRRDRPCFPAICHRYHSPVAPSPTLNGSHSLQRYAPWEKLNGLLRA